MFSSIAVSVCKQVCTYERICMTRARFTDSGPLFNAISRPNAASSSLVSSPFFFLGFLFFLNGQQMFFRLLSIFRACFSLSDRIFNGKTHTVTFVRLQTRSSLLPRNRVRSLIFLILMTFGFILFFFFKKKTTKNI